MTTNNVIRLNANNGNTLPSIVQIRSKPVKKKFKSNPVLVPQLLFFPVLSPVINCNLTL